MSRSAGIKPAASMLGKLIVLVLPALDSFLPTTPCESAALGVTLWSIIPAHFVDEVNYGGVSRKRDYRSLRRAHLHTFRQLCAQPACSLRRQSEAMGESR